MITIICIALEFLQIFGMYILPLVLVLLYTTCAIVIMCKLFHKINNELTYIMQLAIASIGIIQPNIIFAEHATYSCKSYHKLTNCIFWFSLLSEWSWVHNFHAY